MENKMIYRNNKTPTFILIGLLVVIGILSVKYWSALDTINGIRQQLLDLDEKFGQLTIQKNSLDKEKETLSSRVKFFEERVEGNQQLMEKKDSELNDLNKKIRDIQAELDTAKTNVDDLEKKLKTCTDEKTNGETEKLSEKEKHDKETDTYKKTIIDLEDKIKSLSDTSKPQTTSNCDELVKSERNSIVGKLLTAFSDVETQSKIKKTLDIIDDRSPASAAVLGPVVVRELSSNSSLFQTSNTSNSQLSATQTQAQVQAGGGGGEVVQPVVKPSNVIEQNEQHVHARDVDVKVAHQESQIKSPNETDTKNENQNNQEHIIDDTNGGVIEEPHAPNQN